MTELRRFILDPAFDPNLTRLGTIVNRLVDRDNGVGTGRIWLLDDEGDRQELLGGDVIDANNYPFWSRSSIGNHGLFQHSNGATTIGSFQDAGATIPIVIGNTRFANNVDVDGTFNADGAATLGSTLIVTGATTLQSTLAVTGATTLNGAVTLGDAAADVITVTGTATFAEIVTLTKGLVVDTNTLVVDAANNKVGILQATPTAPLTVNGHIQVTSAVTPSGGVGLELSYSTGGALASIVAFDRGATAYKALALDALSTDIKVGGTSTIKVDSTGIGFFAHATAAQPATTAAATDLATVITLANALRTGVRALGLFS